MSSPDRLQHLFDDCCGCGACIAICPTGSLAMETDSEGFMHPVFDSAECVGCGACEKICPALNKLDKGQAGLAFWARALDRNHLHNSSSGGVFGLLAKSFLSAGGAVCGAAWDQDCRHLKHILIHEQSDLGAIQRSKYVQSTISQETYRDIRSALASGRRVLFAGTACQVAGLKGYLGQMANSELLLAVDVICHGVPSPKLWTAWLEHLEKLHQDRIIDVNFRSKTKGWLSYSVAYRYQIAGVDESPYFNDWYMKAFLANASLRPSCFQCPSKLACGSDLTLGDFWGIQNIHPEINWESGISAVICNTENGVAAFANIKDKLLIGESTTEEILEGNPSLISPATPYQKRNAFMNDVASGRSIGLMTSAYPFDPSFSHKIRSKLQKIKGRLSSLNGRTSDI